MASVHQLICWTANSVNMVSTGNVWIRAKTTCGLKMCEKNEENMSRTLSNGIMSMKEGKKNIIPKKSKQGKKNIICENVKKMISKGPKDVLNLG